MKTITKITGTVTETAQPAQIVGEINISQSQKGYWRHIRASASGLHFESSAGGSAFISHADNWAFVETLDDKFKVPPKPETAPKAKI